MILIRPNPQAAPRRRRLQKRHVSSKVMISKAPSAALTAADLLPTSPTIRRSTRIQPPPIPAHAKHKRLRKRFPKSSTTSAAQLTAEASAQQTPIPGDESDFDSADSTPLIRRPKRTRIEEARSLPLQSLPEPTPITPTLPPPPFIPPLPPTSPPTIPPPPTESPPPTPSYPTPSPPHSSPRVVSPPQPAEEILATETPTTVSDRDVDDTTIVVDMPSNELTDRLQSLAAKVTDIEANVLTIRSETMTMTAEAQATLNSLSVDLTTFLQSLPEPTTPPQPSLPPPKYYTNHPKFPTSASLCQQPHPNHQHPSPSTICYLCSSADLADSHQITHLGHRL